MSEETSTTLCPDCKQLMDISDMRPFTLAKCPYCESLTRVRANMGVYTITQKIGVGGMSFVFRATDSVLDRECALKILNENYFDKPERIDRFEKEAKLMAMLHHPNVINVYSVGQEYGHFYIAMELVDGTDVETLIQNNKGIAEDEALRITIEVAEGLVAAQRAGLLHRDMKPANILLTQKGTAKIVDFGLSLLQAETHVEKEIWITPYYAPPETLKRETEDERSDIYSLGATLYHMLLGKPPLYKTPDSIHLLIEAKKHIPELHLCAPEISRQTCDIVDSMLAFDKINRYQSYQDLISDLKIARNDLAYTSRTQKTRSAFFRKRARAKQNRIVIISGAALAFIGVLVGIIAIINSPEPPPAMPITVIAQPEDPKIDDDLIIKTFQQAESLIKKGNTATAIPILKTLYLEPEAKLAISSWCALQNTLCHWILNTKVDINQGRETLRTLRDIIWNNPKEHSPRIKSLDALAKWLLESKKEDLEQLPEDIAHDVVLSELAAGLRCIQEEQWITAEKYLQKFSNKKYPDNPQWIKGFQKMIAPTLELLKTYTEIAALLRKSSNEQEICLDKLQQLLLKQGEWDHNFGQMLKKEILSMQRQLKLTLEQEKLLEIEKAKQKANKIADEAAKIAAEAPPPPAYPEIHKAEKLIQKDWDFDKASKVLFAAISTPDYPEELNGLFYTHMEMSNEAHLFLSTLASDLEGKQIKLVMSTNENTPITITGAKKGKLMSADGAVEWKSLSVKSIISLHSKLTALQKNKKIQMERHSMAIVFLYLIGETNEATERAIKLSDIDDDFHIKWQNWMLTLQQ